jgi:hypothetical protein
MQSFHALVKATSLHMNYSSDAVTVTLSLPLDYRIDASLRTKNDDTILCVLDRMIIF